MVALKKLFAIAFTTLVTANLFAQSLGVFDGQTDVGKVLHKGSASFDASSGNFILAGAGSNIWFNKDEFHYVWKKMSGNFILQARGTLLGNGVDHHRKFGWMVRSGLDTSAAMVSATIHGDGLTSLQFRKTAGENIDEIKSSVSAPDVIQLERKGNKFIMSVAHFGEPFTAEVTNEIALSDDVYVGLFICSHNKDVVEKASFNNVRIIVPAKENFVPYKDYIGSNIEVLDVATGNRKIVYTSQASLQAPNWTRDGKSFIYNSNGLIYRFDIKTKTPSVINTGLIKNNNNDHVLSFDGTMLGLSSASSDPAFGSIVYTVPVNGGTPKQVTPTGPSYLHSWSPDGKYLLFTGQRNNEFDIYKVPSAGGNEVRLTTAAGLDDGSEYSPDGKFIYFNSVRSGRMQIWQMMPDGSNQTQITNDEFNNWFPHVSPDGKSIVFLSFNNDVKPDDHPFYKHVYIRMMAVAGGKPTVIAYVYGGQGSMNPPSWSPDSKQIAFISNGDVQ